jgi:hypothetical protein
MKKTPKPSSNFKKKNKMNGQAPSKSKAKKSIMQSKRMEKAAGKMLFGGKYSK